MDIKHLCIIPLCALVTACGDDPYSDTTPIDSKDYATIRLEMQRCNHISDEGSLTARFSLSPKNDCIKHLQSRIVVGISKSADADPEALEDEIDYE